MRSPRSRPPRVAIACSGLGRVRRGNETWAQTVAEGLHASGMDAVLFGGAPRLAASCPYVHVPSVPRESPLLTRWMSWGRRYLLEQRSFAFFLARRLRREPFDLVHVADPDLALRLKRALGPSGPRVVYKDGLLLGPPWCSRFDSVQVLAPYYREQAEAAGVDTRGWFVIPHLVDTRRFAPAPERAEVRAELLGGGVPGDRLVVLAVGDFSREGSKRLDWVVEEVARLPEDQPAELVVVGQATPREAEAFRERAGAALGGRVHVAPNVPAEQMPRWYQAADVFFHAALREPFGIVFLEAMASGLPVVAHDFPVTRWIVGEGGEIVDMAEAGAAAAVLARWERDRALLRAAGERARTRACDVFSAERILPLYREAYAQAVEAR